MSSLDIQSIIVGVLADNYFSSEGRLTPKYLDMNKATYDELKKTITLPCLVYKNELNEQVPSDGDWENEFWMTDFGPVALCVNDLLLPGVRCRLICSRNIDV